MKKILNKQNNKKNYKHEKKNKKKPENYNTARRSHFLKKIKESIITVFHEIAFVNSYCKLRYHTVTPLFDLQNEAIR